MPENEMRCMAKTAAASSDNHRRKPLITWWLLLWPALFALAVAITACESQRSATPEPTPTSAPTIAPQIASTNVPTPTATPSPTVNSSQAPTPEPNYGPEYWNPPIDYYGEPVYGGTLRINYEDPLEHANVWGAAMGAADRFRAPTGAGLVMEDPYNPYGPVIPDLAQRWETHDGHDGVNFYIRDDATWHNGEPFICEDARFTFETMATGEGLTASYMQSRLSHIVLKEMACLNDSTLSIKFSEPTAIPLHSFSNRRALVFNKAWFLDGDVNAMAEGDLEYAMFTDVSMGIGPFKWGEGQQVGHDAQRFERNPHYYIPELPYLDRLIIYGILDESAQQAAQLAHQTDWHWVRNWDQYRAYVDYDQIKTVIRPTRGHLRFWINARNTPFDNVRVRQAIVMVLGRSAAIKQLLNGHGSVGGFAYPPGSKWELPEELRCSVPGWCEPEDWQANWAQARAILVEEGFDFDNTYLITVESDPLLQKQASFIQGQLGLLGIKTDFDTEWVRRMSRDYRWGDFMPRFNRVPADDPNLGASRYLRCDSIWNFWTPGGPCDENIESLLAQVEVETNFERRRALAHEVELAAMRQYSSIPLYWEQEAAAFWPEARGYVHTPFPSGSFLKFMHMWIDPNHLGDAGNAGQTTGVPGGL